jgi:peptidoglycan/LPS O-acetylase OafA/YrhL
VSARLDPGVESNLDLLRAVAVLTVVVCHLIQVIAGCTPDQLVVSFMDTNVLGRVGVLIFFVHTSLVLMMSMQRSATRVSGWRLPIGFYIRRVFRIYPLSLLLVACSVAFSIPPLHMAGASYQWHGWKWLVSNLLLIQNITGASQIAGVMWSLPYEVQMYLVLPGLFLILRRSRNTYLVAALYGAGVLLSLLHPVLTYFPCFLAGVVAWILLSKVRPWVPAWLWLPFLLAAVTFYTLSGHGLSQKKSSLTCLLLGLAIPLFRANTGYLVTGAKYIARYSYGIYLAHVPLLWLFYRKLGLAGWQGSVCTVLTTAVVSVVCYHAIEQPLIRVGTRLVERGGTPRERACAAASA